MASRLQLIAFHCIQIQLTVPRIQNWHFGHCTLMIYYPTKEAKVWSIRHQESSPVVFLVNLPNFYNLSYLHTVFTLHTLFGVCKMAPRGIKRVRKYQNICMHDSWICALKQKSISCRSLPQSLKLLSQTSKWRYELRAKLGLLFKWCPIVNCDA